MDVVQLIEAAKTALQVESDNQLALKLKVSRATVSNWRHQGKGPDTVTCAKLAEITGIPLVRVLGIVGEARAISREEKAVWRRLASAAAVLLALAPLLSHGQQNSPYGGHERNADICIMRNDLWRGTFLVRETAQSLLPAQDQF